MPEVIDRVVNAYKDLNLEYDFEDIRGGTDGKNLHGHRCIEVFHI